eukprot:Skav214394  [mRNA]  locus=scaffold2495:19264:20842:+ [translate_table: standard]
MEHHDDRLVGPQDNVFYSERTRGNIALDAARPGNLPESLSPEPVMNGSTLDGSGIPESSVGKGRGSGAAGSSGKHGCFVTPPSRRSAWRGQGAAVGMRKTEGALPEEAGGPKSMGSVPAAVSMEPGEGPSHQDDQGLERALERELVDHLKEQNAKLLAQVEELTKQQTLSGSGSVSTTVSKAGVDGSSHGACSSPRASTAVRFTADPRYTPNGTRIPDGPPPTEDGGTGATGIQPPPLPPVPKLQPHSDSCHGRLVGADLSGYDVVNDDAARGRLGQAQWKPLSAGEARALWLEREVATLKNALQQASGNPLSSAYGSFGFRPVDPVVTGDEGAARQATTRDALLRAAADLGADPLHDRAGQGKVLGDVALQARAEQGTDRLVEFRRRGWSLLLGEP